MNVVTREPAAQAGKPDAAGVAAGGPLFRLGTRPRVADYIRSLWARRQLAVEIPRAEISAQHRDTFLGGMWHLIDPLIQIGVWYLLFAVILGVTRGVDNVVGFLAVGVFMFNFTQKAVRSGSRSIIANEGLLRAISFPRAILPLSSVLSELMALSYALPAMFFMVVVTGEQPAFIWLLLFPLLVLQTLFNAGLVLLLARVGTRFRDVVQVLPYTMRVWGMLSGVFYPVTRRLGGRPRLLTIMTFNPAYLFMEVPRRLILDNQVPTTKEWLTLAGWGVGMLVVGFIFFLRREYEYGRG